jgi:hypothetical protein
MLASIYSTVYRANSQVYIFRAPSCTTQFTNPQVPSFGFSMKPSSGVLVIKSHTKNLHLQVGLRSHSLAVYVIKTYVKILKSYVKLWDAC